MHELVLLAAAHRNLPLSHSRLGSSPSPGNFLFPLAIKAVGQNQVGLEYLKSTGMADRHCASPSYSIQVLPGSIHTGISFVTFIDFLMYFYLLLFLGLNSRRKEKKNQH